MSEVIPIHAIVTHEQPHLDEILAIFLLRRFGEKHFPGVGQADLIFWGGGGETPDGRTPQEYEQEGFLLVGTGRGRFDEHPAPGRGRKEGECAATLVSKFLEVENRPELQKILQEACRIDLKGGARLFCLSRLAKLRFRQLPDDPEGVIQWVTEGLEAILREQQEFYLAGQEIGSAEIEEVQGPHGPLEIVAICSDKRQLSKYARHWGAAIVIQKRSEGNVQIFTNHRFGLVLYDVVRVLRYREQEAKGQMVTTDWSALASEGTVAGAEEWYFLKQAQMLLNGSDTAPDVTPTHLSLDQIQEAVRIGINPDAFQEDFAPMCRAGFCEATGDDPCPWYRWGLSRCRRIRSV